jgi:hypothetical protein
MFAWRLQGKAKNEDCVLPDGGIDNGINFLTEMGVICEMERIRARNKFYFEYIKLGVPAGFLSRVRCIDRSSKFRSDQVMHVLNSWTGDDEQVEETRKKWAGWNATCFLQFSAKGNSSHSAKALRG